jgi:hypothetical protein
MTERVAPRYGGGSILNLIASVASHFGVETGHPPMAERLPLDGHELVVLLIVDALGFRQLERHMADGDMPFLRARIEAGEATCRPITSVFPSTTAAGLSTFHTGRAPAEHGMLGYTIWLPEDGVVAELIRFWDLGADIPLARPERLWAVPSLYDRLAGAGVACRVVSARAYRGTALSRFLFGGAAYLGYTSASAIPGMVAEAADGMGSRYVVAYWPGYDEVCHLDGPTGRPASDEAAVVDVVIGRLVRALGGRRGLLLVAADHGQREIDRAEAVALDEDRRLGEWLVGPPAGERCGRFLRVRPGSEAAVAAHLGEVAELAPMDELWADGFFGGPPVRAEFRLRTGDLLAVPRGRRQLHWAWKESDRGALHRGGHGGWTAEEMLVPLVVVPVAE